MSTKGKIILLLLVAGLVLGIILFVHWRKNQIIEMLEQSAEGKNVQAFLGMLRWSENKQRPDEERYRTMFTNQLFDVSAGWQHPNQLNQAYNKDGSPRTYISGKDNKPTLLRSTAAGAYQFIHATWKNLQSRLNLKDFSPANQDLAAIALIRTFDALEDVQAGRIATAMDKLKTQWASLPTSDSGQPKNKMEDVINKYKELGGTIV